LRIKLKRASRVALPDDVIEGERLEKVHAGRAALQEMSLELVVSRSLGARPKLILDPKNRKDPRSWHKPRRSYSGIMVIIVDQHDSKGNVSSEATIPELSGS
jgi:hypothetical protein